MLVLRNQVINTLRDHNLNFKLDPVDLGMAHEQGYWAFCSASADRVMAASGDGIGLGLKGW